MRVLKVLAFVGLGPILLLAGACGALAGAHAAASAVNDWGAGRFWSVAEHEVLLVPEGFEGALTVVFQSPDGEPVRREGVARVYDFRGRRVLRIRDHAPEGRRRDLDYFAVDARGRRRLLSRGDRCREGPTADGLYICSGVTTHVGFALVRDETWVITRDPRMAVAGALAGDTIVEVGRPLRPEDRRPVEVYPLRGRR